MKEREKKKKSEKGMESESEWRSKVWQEQRNRGSDGKIERKKGIRRKMKKVERKKRVGREWGLEDEHKNDKIYRILLYVQVGKDGLID